ncbi:MAG: redoxin domain-containing protein [Planctomycetota bacterium]|jgi:peroxiredoxin
MPIEVGAEAPDFTLQTQDKADWTLSSHRGKAVVLLWYPLDWSPTCTTENCNVSGDLSELEGDSAVVVGLSRDSVWSHKAFRAQHSIQHDLLADPMLEVTKSYGLEHPKVPFISHRASVIVDKDGKVAYVQVQESTGEARDYTALKAALESVTQ